MPQSLTRVVDILRRIYCIRVRGSVFFFANVQAVNPAEQLSKVHEQAFGSKCTGE